jgi:hypothetical protein
VPVVVMDSGPIAKPVIGCAFARPVGVEPLAPSWLRYRPTGKSVNCCPAPFAKIFPFSPNPNQIYIVSRPTPLEGRIAIVTDAGRDAVDAAASGTCVITGRVL